MYCESRGTKGPLGACENANVKMERPPQELLGTPAFLPGLLSYIRSAASPAIPLDKVILQSILLCLVAQDKHLIFRTPEEDIGLAIQLIAWTLSSIFNLQTNKVKVRHGKKQAVRHARSGTPSDSRPRNTAGTGPQESVRLVDSFLLSLFLHSNSTSISSSSSNLNFQEEEPTVQAMSQNVDGTSSRKQTTKHSRQMSFPNNLAAAQNADNTSATASATGLLMQPDLHSGYKGTSTTSSSTPVAIPLSILKPQPVYGYPNPNHRSLSQSPSPRLSHANSEPLPVPGSRRRKIRSHSQNVNAEDAKLPKKLPQALVISGLEHADLAVQRSLATVLSEKKVVLDDGQSKEEVTCPEGFICVYVCAWNATDPPSVHKTLLDKFAMSTDVFIPQNIRNDFRQLSFSMSAAIASPKPLRYNFSYSNPGSPTAPVHVPLPPSHTPPAYTKALPGNSHGYHHHLHSSHQPQKLTSQHSTGSTPPLFPHLPSSHVSYPHSPGTQPPRPPTPFRLPPLPPGFLDALRTAYHRTHVAQTLDLYLSDLMSATRHESRLDGTLLTAKAMKDARDLIRSSRVIGADLTGMELVRRIPQIGEDEGKEESEDDEVDEFHSTRSSPEALEATKHSKPVPILEVSEIDVARIFPRVVSHRLTIRAGPEDEVLASALFGATFKPPPSALQEGERAFNSVKSVLINILSEV